MRKLWAYIVSIFTTLVVVGVSFFTVATRTTSNIEYERGREITFRISVNENVETGKKEISEGDVEEVAEEMKARLESASVTRYQINIAGDDTIKVILSDDDYSLVSTLLEINGTLALCYGDHYITSEEFLLEGKEARFETYNKYPCIVLPTDTSSASYKELLELARTDLSDKTHTEWAEQEESQEEGGEATYKYYLYLVYNFSGNWDLEDLTKDDITYNRLLTKFEVTSDNESQYFPGDDDQECLFNALNIGNGTPDEKSKAYDQARYLTNLINCGPYSFDVKNMFEEVVTVAPWIESKGLVTQSATSNHLVVAWSDTFAACIIAMLVLSLLFTVYFRLGASAMATIGVTSTVIGFLSVILFSAEFNTLGVVGLIIVAIASMASGTLYLSKLKDEAYHGRSLKKANQEAAKKSVWGIVDINIIPIVVAVFVYIFGGAIARGFAAAVFFGSLASLFLNLFALRGLMSLATGSDVLAGKYNWFGIDADKVPSLIKEEKQTYFGAYAEKDLTVNKKKTGIITAALLAVSTFGLIFFGIKNNGSLYRASNPTKVSEVYFETVTKSSSIRNEDFVRTILAKTMVYEDKAENAKALDTYVASVAERSMTEKVDGVEVNHYYYVVTLNTSLDEDVFAYYNKSESNKIGYTTADADRITINSLYDEINSEIIGDVEATITLKEVTTYYTESPQFGKIALGCLVAVASLTVYFLLRYKLSRGLSAFVITLANGVITTGLLSVFAFLSIPSYVIAATPIVVIFTMIIATFYMHKEKEMLNDASNKELLQSGRNNFVAKATSLSLNAAFPFSVFVLYTIINFFGFGPKGTSWIYAVAIGGIILAAFNVAMCFGPLSEVFHKWFHNENRTPKAHKKKAAAKVNKSAEPEEATFIGIND